MNEFMKMKRLMVVFAICLVASQSLATDVIFNLSEFAANPVTNRQVVLQPMSQFPGNLIFLPVTGTNGLTTNLSSGTGLFNGYIAAPPGRINFQIFVTATNLGPVDAYSILGTGSASTYPAGQTAWSIAASDQRYQLSGTTLSNTFYPLFSNPSNYASASTVQPSSGILTNLAVTGANTNQFVGAGTVSLTTNGGIVTITGTGGGSGSATNIVVTAGTNATVTTTTTGGLTTNVVNVPTQTFLTNGLVTAAVTNGLVGPSITNGLVGPSITNGLVGPSITNNLVGATVTNGLVGPSITNGLAGFGVTNGLVAITNGVSTNQTILNATVFATPYGNVAGLKTNLVQVNFDKVPASSSPLFQAIFSWQVNHWTNLTSGSTLTLTNFGGVWYIPDFAPFSFTNNSLTGVYTNNGDSGNGAYVFFLYGNVDNGNFTNVTLTASAVAANLGGSTNYSGTNIVGAVPLSSLASNVLTATNLSGPALIVLTNTINGQTNGLATTNLDSAGTNWVWTNSLNSFYPTSNPSSFVVLSAVLSSNLQLGFALTNDIMASSNNANNNLVNASNVLANLPGSGLTLSSITNVLTNNAILITNGHGINTVLYHAYLQNPTVISNGFVDGAQINVSYNLGISAFPLGQYANQGDAFLSVTDQEISAWDFTIGPWAGNNDIGGLEIVGGNGTAQYAFSTKGRFQLSDLYVSQANNYYTEITNGAINSQTSITTSNLIANNTLMFGTNYGWETSSIVAIGIEGTQFGQDGTFMNINSTTWTNPGSGWACVSNGTSTSFLSNNVAWETCTPGPLGTAGQWLPNGPGPSVPNMVSHIGLIQDNYGLLVRGASQNPIQAAKLAALATLITNYVSNVGNAATANTATNIAPTAIPFYGQGENVMFGPPDASRTNKVQITDGRAGLPLFRATGAARSGDTNFVYTFYIDQYAQVYMNTALNLGGGIASAADPGGVVGLYFSGIQSMLSFDCDVGCGIVGHVESAGNFWQLYSSASNEVSQLNGAGILTLSGNQDQLDAAPGTSGDSGFIIHGWWTTNQEWITLSNGLNTAYWRFLQNSNSDLELQHVDANGAPFDLHFVSTGSQLQLTVDSPNTNIVYVINPPAGVSNVFYLNTNVGSYNYEQYTNVNTAVLLKPAPNVGYSLTNVQYTAVSTFRAWISPGYTIRSLSPVSQQWYTNGGFTGMITTFGTNLNSGQLSIAGSFSGNASGLTNATVFFFTNWVTGWCGTNNSPLFLTVRVPTYALSPATTVGRAGCAGLLQPNATGAYVPVSTGAYVEGGATSILQTNYGTINFDVPPGWGYCPASNIDLSGSGYSAGLSSSLANSVWTNSVELHP